MVIAFWIIGIHLLELLIIGIYLLISKNSKLEKAVIDQQQYIDAISIVIEDSSTTIRSLDNRGAFEADDEVGTFFRSLKEIQDLLDKFNTRQK
jgi:LPS O-antigen subunit length determinant protein (WzzB/FepE family)